jgi:hypothetical protein
MHKAAALGDTMRTLFIALGLTISGTALAAPLDAKLEAWKAEAKSAKDAHKDVSKLVKKWHKAADKDKDTAELDKELHFFVKQDLAWLRDHGVPTKEPVELPKHPLHATAEETPLDQDETPKMEHLRDLLVEIKDAPPGKDKAVGKKLDEYVSILEDRYERKQKKYDDLKDAS